MQTLIFVIIAFVIGFITGFLTNRKFTSHSVGEIFVDELEGPILIFDSQKDIDTIHEKKYVIFRIRKKY